jgi:hypothetical protein
MKNAAKLGTSASLADPCVAPTPTSHDARRSLDVVQWRQRTVAGYPGCVLKPLILEAVSGVTPCPDDGVFFLAGTIACRSQTADAVQNQLMIVRLPHGGTVLAEITGFLRHFCHSACTYHVDARKVGPDPGRQRKSVPVLTIDIGKDHVDGYRALFQDLASLIRVRCFHYSVATLPQIFCQRVTNQNIILDE